MPSSRRVIYAPELCADACLLFSYSTATDRSFRLRHHGSRQSVEIRPEHCAAHVTTSWIRSQVRRDEAAAGSSFGDAGYWRARLTDYAQNWLGVSSGEATFNPAHIHGSIPCPDPMPLLRAAFSAGAGVSGCRFPLADPQRLLSTVKGRKPQDLERIYTSRRSEDYVTWALVCAWRRCRPDWWKAVVELAAEQAPGVDTALFASEDPVVQPWLQQASPPEYERLSRSRMAASSDPSLSARAMDDRPVEGVSEIDLAFVGRSFRVFVEAKLDSDLSLATKYDPTRNQIARGVDCLIEHAGGLAAAWWMFVKDTEPSRLYTGLIQDYRRDPRLLHRLLPHRQLGEIEVICSRLAMITWDQLLRALCLERMDRDLAAVLDEVRDRLS